MRPERFHPRQRRRPHPRYHRGATKSFASPGSRPEKERIQDALNLSLTPSRHIRGMTLYAADGSSFSWQVAKSAVRGFDATFRVERGVSAQRYTEADTRHTLSRDTAISWLRVEAAIRGFDGRGVK
jgi:hypothetical protein